MKFTVYQYGKIVLSADPTQYDSEDAVIKAFQVQKHPDEEFEVKIEDGERAKYCMFDGDNALLILAILCYRGLKDEVFSLNIPYTISDKNSYGIGEQIT